MGYHHQLQQINVLYLSRMQVPIGNKRDMKRLEQDRNNHYKQSSVELHL